jgi:hypothetical protein
VGRTVILMDFREVDWEVDLTGSGSCPVAGLVLILLIFRILIAES